MTNEDKAAAAEAAATDGTGAETISHEQLLLAVEDARAKADEHWNQLLRLRAEMDNVQRRAQRELESAQKYALERFLTELLPVKDSLELGLAAAGDQRTDGDKLREGIDLTLKMLGALLEKSGVKEINPHGQRFNPELHQAMATQEALTVEPNTVLTVFQKGYVLNDRLVRPALVVVAKGGESSGTGGHIDTHA